MRRDYDVIVVGAGPGGLAAAARAAECGARVALVDDNPQPGGQIWRGDASQTAGWTAGRAFEIIGGAHVFAAPEAGCVAVETAEAAFELAYRRLVLATGARERFLPFPGWTLPNVMGAGGLQALVKGGLPIAGKQVVVAGSGPLLLAVANYLRHRGARVRLIAEAAPRSGLVRFARGLARYPAKLAQALRLRMALAGVPYLTSCWPVAAASDRVTLRRGAKTWDAACDYLACGFGLVPNLELAALVGCRLGKSGVEVNAYQETSVTGIYAAGEATGIGGLELSLVEGEIAGFAAGGRAGDARKLFRRRAALGGFAALLEQAFALPEELKSLASDDTFVCRCEDVRFGRVRECAGWREAKLQTRCGMGACQGRVCGAAVEFLLGWRVESMRPPVFPARVASLVSETNFDRASGED